MLRDRPRIRAEAPHRAPAAEPWPGGAGYRSAAYARAFAEFGRPRPLPRSGGWMLERPIPGSARVDAMGPYPLLCCRDWSGIGDDLGDHAGAWVTATAVTDPLGGYDEALLRRQFDRVRPFKDHYIAEMTGPPEGFVSKSHRQNARRALRKVDVEICEDALAHLDDWSALFAVLSRKHGITGLRAFSDESFARQFSAPGLVMFRAVADGETVGLDLWYVDGDVAQGHLAAFSERGYAAGASYATKWAVLLHFLGRVRWVNFGGVPGDADTSAGGLRHFKRGWSNATRKSYLCSRVLDADAYGELCRNVPQTDFFPAYRAGEI